MQITRGAVPHILPEVQKSAGSYSGKIIDENLQGKTVGQISVKAPTSGGFDTIVTNLLANDAIDTAIGGTGSHDSSLKTSVSLSSVTLQKANCLMSG